MAVSDLTDKLGLHLKVVHLLSLLICFYKCCEIASVSLLSCSDIFKPHVPPKERDSIGYLSKELSKQFKWRITKELGQIENHMQINKQIKCQMSVAVQEMFFAGLTFTFRTLQSVPVLTHFSAFSFPISRSLSRHFLKPHHLIVIWPCILEICITMKQR